MSSTEAKGAARAMRPKIYLLGASNTEWSFTNSGWGSSLVDYFSRTADVVLRGYAGYNTRWILELIESVFPPTDSNDAPIAMTVFLGSNDASHPDREAGFRHVPIDEYKRNLMSIVAYLKIRWPSTHIILITPTPIDEDQRVTNPPGLPDRTNEDAGRYAEQCFAAAAELGVPVINLWLIMQQNPDWKQAYLTDGLHFTPEGNRVVFEQVIEGLGNAQITPEKLPTDLPLIDAPNPPIKSSEDGSLKQA